MKKIFLFIAAAAMITSCGGNKSEKDSAEDTMETIAEEAELADAFAQDENAGEDAVVSEEEEESEGWTVPFQFERSHSYMYMNDEYKTVTVYKLLKNGKLSVTEIHYEKTWDSDTFKEKNREEIGGKWSTTSISRGEGYQKVYVIDRADYDNSLYLPDDLEYFWNRGSGSDYFDCENYDIKKAVKVENPKKL